MRNLTITAGTRLLIGRDILEVDTVTKQRGRILYQGRVVNCRSQHSSHISRADLVKHFRAGKAHILRRPTTSASARTRSA